MKRKDIHTYVHILFIQIFVIFYCFIVTYYNFIMFVNIFIIILYKLNVSSKADVQ